MVDLVSGGEAGGVDVEGLTQRGQAGVQWMALRRGSSARRDLRLAHVPQLEHGAAGRCSYRRLGVDDARGGGCLLPKHSVGIRAARDRAEVVVLSGLGGRYRLER